MPVVATPLVALVGFKRSKLAMLGGVRLLVVRDGVARLLDGKGTTDLDVAMGELTVRLTRTKTVELRTDSVSAYVYGIPDATRIREDLKQVIARELDLATGGGTREVAVLGPVPSGFTTLMPIKELAGQIRMGNALAEALRQRGAAGD
ncbi:hypothetical protein ABZ639_00665 [Saccharomonospora sp. NPDC006951]